MPDKTITSPETIQEILSESSRLRFVLSDKYGLHSGNITSIYVDGDNFKLDIFSGEAGFRFKAKGLDSVLLQDPETRAMSLQFDPALAQAIYEICDSYT
ncbi:MAG: hypothetical protein H6581_16405 [Bacteroidia bacterium]|nr:hypothetical protein [Bacteroidia bacterium]